MCSLCLKLMIMVKEAHLLYIHSFVDMPKLCFIIITIILLCFTILLSANSPIFLLLDGIVKARHPDFKKRDNSSIALWLENAPRWVLEGVEGLQFDVYVPKSKGVGKEVDSWKDLLENPDNWWDNRTTKLNQKAPDFKHKNTGIGLWVDNSPGWVLSQLLPSRDQRAAYKMNQS